MSARTPNTEDDIAQLASTAQALSALIQGQPEFALHHKPAADVWSVTEILGHLVDNERESVAPNLTAILTDDAPALIGYDQDAAVRVAGYLTANASDLVIAFDERRTDTVAALRALTPPQWERVAHDGEGHTYTLAHLTSGVAEHDRAHLAQIAETLRRAPGAHR